MSAGVGPAMDVGSRIRRIRRSRRRCELRRTFYHVYSRLATLAIVTLLTASCGGRNRHLEEPAPLHPPVADDRPPVSLDSVHPLFQSGEQITWEVTFRGIEGGRARMAIGETALVDGRQVLALHADAESSGLLAIVKTMHDDVSAWLDADTGLPLRTVGNSNTSGKETHAEATFDHVAHRAQIAYSIGKGPLQKTGRRLPPTGTYDPLGVILMLRGWDAPDGARTIFHTLGGRTVWRTELVVDGRELRDTKLGKLACIRMTGSSRRLSSALAVDEKRPARKFTVWLTDDARRVPLQIRAYTEMGDLDVQLTSYESPPVASAAR
jgi:hypothetical protein